MNLNSSLFEIPIVNNVLVYDTISSTNDKAKELARRGSVHGSLVVGKSQTQGKGRLGRSFDSSSSDGLYISLMLRPNISTKHLSRITLITALAVAKAIEHTCGLSTHIKWPNDITVNGRKLVGILTEAGPDYIVIGIGINVNNKSFNSLISQIATSIFIETGIVHNKESILKDVLWKLSYMYEEFIKSDNLSDNFLSEYNNRLGSVNKEVFLIPQELSNNSSNPYSLNTNGLTPMLCKGIDSLGNLICIDSKGNPYYVNSGEISLREQ